MKGVPEASRSDARTTSIGSFFDATEQRLYLELPPDAGAPQPISKAEPSRSPEESHFGHLHPERVNGKLGWEEDGDEKMERRWTGGLGAESLIMQVPYWTVVVKTEVQSCKSKLSVSVFNPHLWSPALASD